MHSRASAQLVVHVAPLQWRWHVASVLHSTLHAAPVQVMSQVAPSLQRMSQRLEEQVIAQAAPAGHSQVPASGHVTSCTVAVLVPPPAPEVTVQSRAHPPQRSAEAVTRATQRPILFVRMEGARCTPRATSRTQPPTLPQLTLLRSRRPMVPCRSMASWKHPRGGELRTSREGAIRGPRGTLRRGARALAAALFVAGALAVPAPSARADDTKDAREAYDRGARAFGQGSYAVAATEFSRADELGPTPAALEMALKAAILAEDPVLAMSLVDRADARAPNASVAAQVARARDRFSDKVARVKITCPAPCSAKVGQEPAQLGVSRYYRAGNYVVEITTTGAPEIFAVQLPGGTDMEWKPPPKALPAEATATSATSAAPSTPAPPTASVAATPATATPTSAPLAPRASTLSPAWFAVGAGVTAIAGGLTIGFGLDTLSKHDAFLIHRTEDGASAGQDAQLRTNVFAGVTAAAAVATAVIGYFAFRPSGAASTTPTTGRAALFEARPLHASTPSWSPASPLIAGALPARTTSVAR